MDLTCERRRMPRTSARIEVEDLGGGPSLTAHDLSLGGMLVTTTRPRWPGQHLLVRFSVPGEPRRIRAMCRVVDLVPVERDVGLAMKFLRLAPDAQLALHHYIDQRPLPAADDTSLGTRLEGWLRRMVEDCAELKELARTRT